MAMVSYHHLTTCLLLIILIKLSAVSCDKYKVCVVDGRGAYKKSGRYCPILDNPDSRVECVIGIDRLDCLRRISKGNADFAVFSPEDLVVARNSEVELLITNELRYTKDDHEYEVVAVINDASGIKSRHDLKDKKLCHPGYGYETHWTRILANYLEASTVTPLCDQDMTLTENRIKASSDFFKAACKAGPWVNNDYLDQQLKRKYRNLCSLCNIPEKCDTEDKYWGRQGSLFCLTDGAGDISWARLDDVQQHFGITPGATFANPDGYSFLCPDDTIKPVNTSKPCVWIARPWPVVASKRTSAQDVQEIISNLSHNRTNSWQSALLNIIETFHLSTTSVDPVEPIQTYLNKASGFLSANSFTGCHPPRTIRICTTSNIDNTKCGWLRETASVYGIEPDLDCLKADNTTHCMQAINDDVADVVMVPPDLVHTAKSKFNMKTLFYETVYDNNKYITVAVVKSSSWINDLDDLRGTKACFPVYDGIAYNTAKQALHSRKLLDTCQVDEAIANFFASSCVPNLPNNKPKNLNTLCEGQKFNGEYGAIRCLTNGKSDVAFISKNSLVNFLKDPNENPLKLKEGDFKILCQRNAIECHLSWAPVGQAMVPTTKSDLWTKDSLDVFMRLDNLFGKNYKMLTTPYSLFGAFNGKENVLFSDATVRFRDVPVAKNTDKMIREYDDIIENIKTCTTLSSSTVMKSAVPLILLMFSLVLL